MEGGEERGLWEGEGGRGGDCIRGCLLSNLDTASPRDGKVFSRDIPAHPTCPERGREEGILDIR